MTDKEEKEEEEKRGSGTLKDNDMERIQKIMKDNDLPVYHSKKEEDEEDED